MSHERPVEIRGHKFIRMKSGRLITFWDATRAAERSHTGVARALSRAFKLAKDDDDLEMLEWQVERIEDHISAVRQHIDKLRGNLTKRERIKQLREVTGRTPDEAALFQEKADELERAITD